MSQSNELQQKVMMRDLAAIALVAILTFILVVAPTWFILSTWLGAL